MVGRVLILVAMMAGLQTAQVFAGEGSVDLMAYMQAHVQAPVDPGQSTIPKYDRLAQFGGWVHQDPTKSCHDTREMVLAREEDSSTPVGFSPNGCSIKTGLWHDPYTGQDVTDSNGLQIDHVVPLRETYYAGAYAWAPAVRCNYANYLGNAYHLHAVSGHENMSKGDSAPDGYLPPNQADLCNYVGTWMKIKAIWQLSATSAEIAAIQKVINDQSCDQTETTMPQDELDSQRATAAQPISQCVNFGN